MSIFDSSKLIILDGKVYERLDPAMFLDEDYCHKYRVLLQHDDYDYVEDEELIAELDKQECI